MEDFYDIVSFLIRCVSHILINNHFLTLFLTRIFKFTLRALLNENKSFRKAKQNLKAN